MKKEEFAGRAYPSRATKVQQRVRMMFVIAMIWVAACPLSNQALGYRQAAPPAPLPDSVGSQDPCEHVRIELEPHRDRDNKPIAGDRPEIAAMKNLKERQIQATGQAKAELSIQCASLILTFQVERELSLYWYHAATPEDITNARVAIDEALALLHEGCAWYSEAGRPSSQPTATPENPVAAQEPPTEKSSTLKRGEDLLVFAEAMKAWLKPKEDASKEEARRLVAELSVMLESENKAVVTAAKFYIAALAQNLEPDDRVLRKLDSALEDPDYTMPSLSLMTRLERCMILSDQGQPATALALALQFEERCGDWMLEAELPIARKTAALVQRKILLDWIQRASDAENLRLREQCERMLAKTCAVLETYKDHPVLRLEYATPFMVLAE